MKLREIVKDRVMRLIQVQAGCGALRGILKLCRWVMLLGWAFFQGRWTSWRTRSEVRALATPGRVEGETARGNVIVLASRRQRRSMECQLVTTQQELDDALWVRWKVFGEEMGLLAPSAPLVERELDRFDTLPSTRHFVVYAGREPVATVRLLLQNPAVARANGQRFGNELEHKLDLSGFQVPGLVLAEVTRCCVRKGWRHSQALKLLHECAYRESRRLGVSHWIGCANTETDSLRDARIAYRVALHQGLVSPRWRVQALHEGPVLLSSRHPLYGPGERRRALRGDVSGLRLPRTLALFAHRIGVRFIGGPIYDPTFRMCSMPFAMELDTAALGASPSAPAERCLSAAA